MDKAKLIEILKAANAAPFVPAPVSGCGRAYVCVSDKALGRVMAAACKELGMLFSPHGHYGVGPRSIYIGYDNADGIALGKSRAFAKVLNELGVDAYDDCAGD